LDADDKCPDVAGLATLQRLPDRDGDGHYWLRNTSLTLLVLQNTKGYPIPDTKLSGVNDEQDKCPTVKGLARYQGCPIPDAVVMV
jgi:hypothetical protein